MRPGCGCGGWRALLAAGTHDGAVRLWTLLDRANGLPAVDLPRSALAVEDVSFSPDGMVLAVGGDDSTVRLYQLADPGHPRLAAQVRADGSVIFAVAVSPDGRTLAAGTGAGHDVYLWDISDPQRPRAQGVPLTGPATWVNTVDFSPDGSTLAAGSSDGRL